MLVTLREHLGEALVASDTVGAELCVRVAASAWKQAAEACRDHLLMDYFCFLAGMDWLANPDLSGEKVWDPDGGAASADPEAAVPVEVGVTTGVAGGDSRFQVFARLQSVGEKVGITLKADLDESDPRIESWVSVYRGADWHEREAWEMYGFNFDGHPGLRHMYLPGEFEGYPMRKDFPLLAREVKPWPGLVDVEPMPGEDVVADDTGAETSEEAG